MTNMFTPSIPSANQIMLVPIQGESWAQMYPVAAGTTVALIDFDAGFFWLKNATQLRKFKFEEIVQVAPGNDNTAMREEIASLKSQMQEILTALKGAGKDE